MSTARRSTSAGRRIALNLGRVLVLGSTVSVLAAVSGSAPASAAFPGENGRIAFVSTLFGSEDVFVYATKGAGSVLTRLTNSASSDREPAFSPDGTRIVFTSHRDGNDEIYVMNADGSHQSRLTNNSAFDFQPAFSPDGTQIVFASTRSGGPSEVYVMDADGSDQTRLTNNPGVDGEPAFSPDGTQIAFTSARDGNYEVYVMDADGADPTNLTNNLASESEPAFSPDGSQIAFNSLRNGSFEVYVMHADGTGQTRLTNNPAEDRAPAFSPDGTRIAFSSDRGGDFGLFVMNVDGTGQANLTDVDADETAPDWGVDLPPVAVDDATTVDEDSSATAIDVLANDTDVDGGPKAIASSTDPDHGTVVLTGGTPGARTGLTYAPDAGYCNDPNPAPADTFSYRLNGGSTATVSVTVICEDHSAPETTITGGPGALTNDATPTFTFTSSEPGSTFECRLEDADFSPCTSPVTLPAQDDRAHGFYVRAIDASGNVDETPAARIFQVDTTPPDTIVLEGPEGLTTDATPTFAFRASELDFTSECRLDDAPFSPCTSPQTLPALDDGTHTYEMRVKDNAGNVDPTPASRTFTVDTVVPDTTITGGPDGATNDNTPTFTFVSSEPGSTFECSVDGAFSDCTSPYTSGEIGDGEHTFRVRAKDAAGNEDASPASRTFTLDRNPPTTSITSGPSGVTGDSTPTFGFTSPEPGATFECRVDDAAFKACTTPHTTAELADGDHVFQARSVDGVGNVDPIPAARAFTVDTVPPDTEIVSGPSGLINDRTPSVSFSDIDGAQSHECRVDDEPFARCESPTTMDPLSDGAHTFEVRAIDGGGNVDPTPARLTFTVDTEIFRTGITGGPSGLTGDSTPTFSFATPDPNSTFECRVAPAPFADCTSPFTAPEQSDGDHTFEVRATDSYGNVEPTPAKRSFTVDSIAPDTTMDSGPTGTIDDQTPTFGFSSPEAGATFECRVDDADFGPCASPYTTAPLDNGGHTFQSRAIDAAGNADATPASRAFTVKLDVTPPKTRIDSGPADLTNQTSATFTFSADEPATFECKLDAGAYAACESGDSFGPLGSGTHTFAVRATDEAGNVDAGPATKTWIIDTTPPQTTITSGPAGLSLLSSKATFGFASSEGGSTFQCRLDGGAWQSCTSPWSVTQVHLGNHTVSVRATDPAGNVDPTPATKTWVTLGLLPL